MFKLSIIGNIGNDAVIREAEGSKFISFSVAVDQGYKQKDGTKVEKTQWVSCVINNEKSGLLPWLKKGTKVYVDGRADVKIFKNKDVFEAGITLQVQNCDPFLSKKPEDNGAANTDHQEPQS